MPKTSAEPALKIPGFRYGGFEVPTLALKSSLAEDIGTFEPAYQLAPKSAPLAWKAGLYLVGRDLALYGGDLPKNLDALPDSVKEAGKAVYARCQEKRGEGAWHKDGVLFLKRSDVPKGMTRPKDENYVLALYFKDIEGFEQKGDNWVIKPTLQTIEQPLWLPAGGGQFYVPTQDGTFHPVTGTPFETVKSEEEAIRRWMDVGLTEEQARNELSLFYRMDEGTAAVDSWSGPGDGPLGIGLGYGPLGRNSDLGSFPSVAERSEAGPQNSGFVTVRTEEYRALKKLAADLRTLTGQLPDE